MHESRIETGMSSVETDEAIAVFISPADPNDPGWTSSCQLAERTLETLAELGSVDKYVYTDPCHEDWLRGLLPDESFSLELAGPRGAANLADKVYGAFEFLFEAGYQRILAVGADTPGMSADLLVQSLRILRNDESEAVVGPSSDGGFYLLGLQSLPRNLFTGVPFFSNKTYDSLLNNLGQLVGSVAVVETLADIDAFDDWSDLGYDTLAESFGWVLRRIRREFNCFPCETRPPQFESLLNFLKRSYRAPPRFLTTIP